MAIDRRSPGAESSINFGPGPFVGKVVEHLDARNQGGLKVILESNTTSSNDPNVQGQEVYARYLSPFYGITSVDTSSQNLDYRSGQQSYGMWMVPPDPGSKVLVILVEGNINQAFWIGCIQDEFMNFMVPDGRPATSNLVEGGVTDPRLQGKKLPATEFNKNFEFQGTVPNNFAKPVNAEFANTLIQQGLVEDEVRGITSTSARRETPSMVFGVSSPGPLDKRPGAPRGRYGFQSGTVNHFRSRLGGSSMVMDDGDERLLRKGPAKDSPMEYVNKEAGESGGDPTLPHNELFRIRTRTGHQILLHNTEDLIYIGNSRGTAWIELTSNGKIDIYAQDSVSIHSAVDLNFTADRDINLTASKDINIISENVKTTSYKATSITAGTTFSTNSGKNTSINSHKDVAIYATNDGSIIAGQKQTVISSENLSLGSVTGVGIEGHGYIKMTSDGDIRSLSKGTTKITAESEMHLHSDLAFKVKSDNVFALTATGSILAKSDETIGIKSAQDTIIKSDTKVDIQNTTPPVPPTPTLADIPPAPSPVPSTPPSEALPTNRVPMHEPWFQHENINPEEYTPEKTRAGDQSAESYPPGTPDTFIRGPGGTVSQPGARATTWNSGTGVTTSGGFTPISGIDIPQDPEPIRIEKQELSRVFAAALFAEGFNEEEVYAAIACAETESNLQLIAERSYSGTANDRIRSIFRGARQVTDAELTEIKADRNQFFELVYGPGNSTGIGLGNTTVGDGARYVGRGLIQLTGKGNYQRYGRLAGLTNPGLETDYNPFGVEIVGEPGDDAPLLLLTDVQKSVAVTAAYLKERYRDFGFDVLGNMRMAIAGTDRGYELGRPKDLGYLENKKLADGSYDPAWITEVDQERYFVSTVDGYTTYRATADLDTDLAAGTGPFVTVPPGTTLIVRDNEAGGQLYEFISDNGTDWRRRNTITGEENGIVRTS
jgi:uncharacterized protein (DUF2345 family)